MHRIGTIGAGKMAFALAKAIERSNLAESIIMSDKNKERLDYVKKNSVASVTKNNLKVLKEAEIIFLAVKPQQMEEVLKEIKSSVKDHIIISIAAGIPLSFFNKHLKGKSVIRVMPNIPCLVGEMAAAYSLNENVDEQDANIVHGLLNSAGIAFKVDEDKLDAVTGLSGSGPGFFAKIVKNMIEAGIEEGLSNELAKELAYQTMKGTGKLLLEKELSPDELIEMVASPKGTTVAGLEVLEKSDAIIKKTIKAAVKRSKELGKND